LPFKKGGLKISKFIYLIVFIKDFYVELQKGGKLSMGIWENFLISV